jgi:predicted DNA binding CopG/RHH family protein
MEPKRKTEITTRTIRPAFVENELPLIRYWHELPAFESEEEEVRYWATHQLDARLMHLSIHRNDVRESTTITLRFDPRMLSRIKRIARRRYLNYQSMIKQWLSERMEQETKEG